MFESCYTGLVNEVLTFGELREGRNGTTKALFGTTLTFDLQQEFPMLNMRRMFPSGILGELAAMLRGPKHINDFKRWNCNYWDKWAKPDGSIAVDYGNVWHDFNGVNQIDQLRESLIASPTSRRMLITGWRPGADVDLPCCHVMYQFYVREGKYLDMIWTQRSADVMVGVPSDAVFAAAWLIAICAEFTWLTPGRCVMNFGDTHIYAEHFEEAKEYADSVVAKLCHGKAPAPVTWSCDEVTTNFCEFEPNWIGLHNINPLAPRFNFVLKD